MGKILKFQQIVDWSVEQIKQGTYRPGDKFPSEHELSKQFDFSRQTIRNALRILEQQQYINRIRGSGTYVLDTIPHTRSRTMNIGVISTYLDDYIFPGIIRGVETILSANGYAMQFALTGNKIARESRALRHLLKTGVDGLIVEPTKSGLPNPNLSLYHKIQVPVVFFNANYPDLPHHYVALDDIAAGQRAAEYLLNAGHTHIAGIFLHNDLQGHRRYSGYWKAHQKKGLVPQEDHIYWYSTEDIPEIFCSSTQIMNRIQNCTAVLCYNDQLAVRLIDFLHRHKIRIPEDISVVSIDDSELAAMCTPPLTAIAHPIDRLGEIAAKTLLDMIAGDQGQTTLFEPVITERKSVRNMH